MSVNLMDADESDLEQLLASQVPLYRVYSSLSRAPTPAPEPPEYVALNVGPEDHAEDFDDASLGDFSSIFDFLSAEKSSKAKLLPPKPARITVLHSARKPRKPSRLSEVSILDDLDVSPISKVSVDRHSPHSTADVDRKLASTTDSAGFVGDNTLDNSMLSDMGISIEASPSHRPRPATRVLASSPARTASASPLSSRSHPSSRTLTPLFDRLSLLDEETSFETEVESGSAKPESSLEPDSSLGMDESDIFPIQESDKHPPRHLGEAGPSTATPSYAARNVLVDRFRKTALDQQHQFYTPPHALKDRMNNPEGTPVKPCAIDEEDHDPSADDNVFLPRAISMPSIAASRPAEAPNSHPSNPAQDSQMARNKPFVPAFAIPKPVIKQEPPARRSIFDTPVLERPATFAAGPSKAHSAEGTSSVEASDLKRVVAERNEADQPRMSHAGAFARQIKNRASTEVLNRDGTYRGAYRPSPIGTSAAPERESKLASPSFATGQPDFYRPPKRFADEGQRARSLIAKLEADFPNEQETFRQARAASPTASSNAPVWVFVDHSNVLFGFLSYLRQHPELAGAASNTRKPRLHYGCLFAIFERGRQCARKCLVGSMPLHQGLIDAESKWKYEVNLLKRVVSQTTHDPTRRRLDLVETDSEDSSSDFVQPVRKDNHRNRKGAKERKKVAGRTMKEQAVDELLHSKIYAELFKHRNRLEGSTLVLCTGDANASEFSEAGFLGCATEALEAGCKVEILAFSASISSLWWQKQKETNGRLTVIPLDRYASELLE